MSKISLVQTCLDLIFPPHCPSCGKELPIGKRWCPNCLEELMRAQAVHIIPQDLEQKAIFEEVYVLAPYTKGMKKLIHDVKFKGKRDITQWLYPFSTLFNQYLIEEEIDFVIPVPISSKGLHKRGYNQVDVLFKRWVDESQYSHWSPILCKLNHTMPMYGLHKEQRKENIKGAFIFRKEYWTRREPNLENKNILIVDDILTTGQTLLEVGRIIKGEHPKKIKALTMASGALT